MVRFRLFFILGLLGLSLVLSSCETSDYQRGSASANSNQTNTSAIPWNQPQSWEGPGAYGAMMPGTR